MSKVNLRYTGLVGFKSLFDSLYPRLCLFANKYIGDMDISKDIVQEVFIKIWKKKPEFENQKAAKAYLYTAVKNHCLNCLKSKNFKIKSHSVDIDLVQLQSEESYLTKITTVETYAELYEAIETLPAKTAKVIQLSLNNYTTKEIAEELSVTQSTVRSQKSLAYQKLRGLLNHLNNFFTFF